LLIPSIIPIDDVEVIALFLLKSFPQTRIEVWPEITKAIFEFDRLGLAVSIYNREVGEMRMNSQNRLVLEFPHPIPISAKEINYFLLLAREDRFKLLPHALTPVLSIALYQRRAMLAQSPRLRRETINSKSAIGRIGGNGQTEVRFTLGGDASLDQKVDVGDLGALATNYGLTANAVWAQGDFNNDGKVDVGDLGILATNYGQTLGGGGGGAANAPSPAAVALSDNATFSTVAITTPAVAQRSLWGELQTSIDPAAAGDLLRI
jgi:hypothetical protein